MFKKYLKYSLVIATFIVAILGLFSETNQSMTRLNTGDLITLNIEFDNFKEGNFICSDLKLSSSKYAENIYEECDIEFKFNNVYTQNFLIAYTSNAINKLLFSFDHAIFENNSKIPLYLLFCILKIDTV